MLLPKKSIKKKPEKGAKAVKTQGQRGTDTLGRQQDENISQSSLQKQKKQDHQKKFFVK
jgi:hypothetical protein